MLLVAAIPKFAAQAIRKVHDLNWKPMFFMSNVAISVGAVMNPAGPENGIGIISAAYLKDSVDPTWKDDPGMNEWRDFMTKRMPGADQTDGGYIAAYGLCKTMLQVLQQANGDFSRANIMKQVTSLHDVENPVCCRASSSTPARPTTIRSRRCSWRNGMARPGCCSAT